MREVNRKSTVELTNRLAFFRQMKMHVIQEKEGKKRK